MKKSFNLTHILITVFAVALTLFAVSCTSAPTDKGEEKVKYYTVTFYAKNPETLEDELFERIKVKKGDRIPQTMNIPDHYESEGRYYYFSGWIIKDELADISKYTVKKNTELTAHYSSTKKTFTLIFDCGDFHHYEPNVNYGDKITYTGPMPTKECTEEGYDYLFKGFSRTEQGEVLGADEDDFSDLLDSDSTVVKTETFYPRFVKVKKVCAVKYYDFQGDVSYIQTVEYGDKIKKLTDKDKSERLGYSFIGFFYFDGNGALLRDLENEFEVKSDISVKEIWNHDPVEYELTYLSMDKTYKKVNYTIEDEIDVSKVLPKANGCTFEGWYDKSTEQRVTYIHKGSYGPKVLVAKYKANPTVEKDLNSVVESKVGNNVNLEFVVDAPLGSIITYQWYKDGNAIENAVSSTYTILGLEKNNGEYVCVAGVDIKGAESTRISSTPSLVYISDTEAKMLTVTYKWRDETKQTQIKVGGKIDLSFSPEGYEKDSRKYVFDHWELDGVQVSPNKMLLKDATLVAVYMPIYKVNYLYNGVVIDSEEVVKGHTPKATLTKDALAKLPEVKAGYEWSAGILNTEIIDRDVDAVCKMELNRDIQVFLEQSLDCVFNEKEIGFTVNLDVAGIRLKLFVAVKIKGLRVEDLHGAGKDFKIADLIDCVDIKIKSGTTNPVIVHIVNKTFYVTTNGGTFKTTYQNVVDILETTGVFNLKELLGQNVDKIDDIILNMVDVIDKTAETVESITLDTTTNKLTIIPNIGAGVTFTITSDIVNDKYSVNNINLSYGDKISFDCQVTQGLSISTAGDATAADYTDAIKNLTDSIINLVNGRHYKITGNVTLDSPKADVGLEAKIDRYETGDVDYYGNPVTTPFSAYHLTIDLPKISMVVSIVKDKTVSEIFVDTRYPDLILFKRTVNGSSVEYKSNLDFMKDGKLDTMSLVVWLANLGNIVNKFAGSTMTVDYDLANLLKSVTYADGVSKIVLSKDALVFSDDMIAVNKDVEISIGVNNGYPTRLSIGTAMSLAGILKPNINLNLTLDDEVTRNNTDLGAQKEYADLKNSQFATL